MVDTFEIADKLARDGAFAHETLFTDMGLERAFAGLHLALEQGTNLLCNDFEVRLQAMTKELVRWFAVMMLAHGITVIGVIVALVKLL